MNFSPLNPPSARLEDTIKLLHQLRQFMLRKRGPKQSSSARTEPEDVPDMNKVNAPILVRKPIIQITEQEVAILGGIVPVNRVPIDSGDCSVGIFVCDFDAPCSRTGCDIEDFLGGGQGGKDVLAQQDTAHELQVIETVQFNSVADTHLDEGIRTDIRIL